MASPAPHLVAAPTAVPAHADLPAAPGGPPGLVSWCPVTLCSSPADELPDAACQPCQLRRHS